jgi:hypothetical protein
MEDSIEKKRCFETGTGISFFGIHIPYWLIVLILLIFVVYMFVENKTPYEVLSLSFPEPLTFSSEPLQFLDTSISFVKQ